MIYRFCRGMKYEVVRDVEDVPQPPKVSSQTEVAAE